MDAWRCFPQPGLAASSKPRLRTGGPCREPSLHEFPRECPVGLVAEPGRSTHLCGYTTAWTLLREGHSDGWPWEARLTGSAVHCWLRDPSPGLALLWHPDHCCYTQRFLGRCFPKAPALVRQPSLSRELCALAPRSHQLSALEPVVLLRPVGKLRLAGLWNWPRPHGWVGEPGAGALQPSLLPLRRSNVLTAFPARDRVRRVSGEWSPVPSWCPVLWERLLN